MYIAGAFSVVSGLPIAVLVYYRAACNADAVL